MNLQDMMNELNQQMASPEAMAAPKRSFADERVYKISKDKDGNGAVLIRFLPMLNPETKKLDTFIIKKFHSINNKRIINGKEEKVWSGEFICPQQHGDDCLICKYGWDNYAETKEKFGKDDKATKAWLKYTSSEKYLSNILVIDDKINPDNNGKVFVLEYGSQLQKLIAAEMHPTQAEIDGKGMKSFNAWDMGNAKNFYLQLTDKKFTDNGFPSWSKSFFVPEFSAIANTNEDMMTLIESVHDLYDFVKPELVPNKEDLQKKLDEVNFVVSKKKDDKPAVQSEAAPVVQQFNPVQQMQQQTAVVETQVAPVVETQQEQIVSAPVQQEVVQPTTTVVTEAPAQQVQAEPTKETPATNMDDFFAQFKQ